MLSNLTKKQVVQFHVSVPLTDLAMKHIETKCDRSRLGGNRINFLLSYLSCAWLRTRDTGHRSINLAQCITVIGHVTPMTFQQAVGEIVPCTSTHSAVLSIMLVQLNYSTDVPYSCCFSSNPVFSIFKKHFPCPRIAESWTQGQ